MQTLKQVCTNVNVNRGFQQEMQLLLVKLQLLLDKLVLK